MISALTLMELKEAVTTSLDNSLASLLLISALSIRINIIKGLRNSTLKDLSSRKIQRTRKRLRILTLLLRTMASTNGLRLLLRTLKGTGGRIISRNTNRTITNANLALIIKAKGNRSIILSISDRLLGSVRLRLTLKTLSSGIITISYRFSSNKGLSELVASAERNSLLSFCLPDRLPSMDSSLTTSIILTDVTINRSTVTNKGGNNARTATSTKRINGTNMLARTQLKGTTSTISSLDLLKAVLGHSIRDLLKGNILSVMTLSMTLLIRGADSLSRLLTTQRKSHNLIREIDIASTHGRVYSQIYGIRASSPSFLVGAYS